MSILAIETATANRNHPASIALRHDGMDTLVVLSEPNSQAAQLINHIEKLLNEHQLWYTDLKELLITVGPGSFTGIRIGLSVARALSFACQSLELKAMTTLETFAAKYEGDVPFTAMLYAGKGDVYTQPFTKQSGLWQSGAPIALVPADQLDESTTYFGNGIGVNQEQLDALDLLNVNKRVSIESREAIPLYIRPPDAKLPTGAYL